MAATRRRGFSLLELSLVVVIVGIAAAIAIPRFSHYLSRQRVEAAAQRLRIDLEQARDIARHASRTVTVEIAPASNRYRISGRAHPDHPGRTFEIAVSDAPYHCEIVSAKFDGLPTFKFNAYGRPSASGEVLLRAGGANVVVRVRAEGGVEVVTS